MSLDLDTLVAIDTHVHVEQDSKGCCSLDQELLDASAKYFKGDDNRTPTVGDLADYYRERRIGAVVFTVDSTTAMGHPALSSEEILRLAADHDDILIPFASVDPLADDAPDDAPEDFTLAENCMAVLIEGPNGQVNHGTFVSSMVHALKVDYDKDTHGPFGQRVKEFAHDKKIGKGDLQVKVENGDDGDEGGLEAASETRPDKPEKSNNGKAKGKNK